MTPISNRIAPVLLAAALSGCAAPMTDSECEFALRKSRTELSELRRELAQEQARNAGLVTELESRSRERDALRAETSSQKERLAELQRTADELDKLLRQRAAAALEKPQSPPSPLSANVDQRLADFAAKHAPRVTYARARAAVSFANDRLFDSGSDAIRPESYSVFRELAEILNLTSPDEFEIIIVGHTDSQPIVGESVLARHPSNWYLSVHRAIAVRDLLNKFGVPDSRMGVMGYAEQRPIGADAARNRRVEVFLATKGAVQPLAPVRTP